MLVVVLWGVRMMMMTPHIHAAPSPRMWPCMVRCMMVARGTGMVRPAVAATVMVHVVMVAMVTVWHGVTPVNAPSVTRVDRRVVG